MLTKCCILRLSTNGERERDRQNRQIGGFINGRQMDAQTDRHTKGQTDRQTEKQVNGHSGPKSISP